MTANLCTQIERYLVAIKEFEREPNVDAIVEKVLHAPRQAQREVCAWLTGVHPDLALPVQVAVAAQQAALHLETTYTTATSDYDGFGTELVAFIGRLKGVPVRQVETPGEHLEWQRMRYGSGSYGAYTPEEFQALISHAWAGYVPTEPVTLSV